MDRHEREIIDRVSLGLSAAAFAAILTMLSISPLDVPLRIALGCFAVAIPINVGVSTFLHPSTTRFSPLAATEKELRRLYVVGIWISSAGIDALLWHFSWVFGAALLLSSSAMLWRIIMLSLR